MINLTLKKLVSCFFKSKSEHNHHKIEKSVLENFKYVKFRVAAISSSFTPCKSRVFHRSLYREISLQLTTEPPFDFIK